MTTPASAPPSLEGIFPPGWDFARDVLVVVGTGGAELYGALAAAGQTRVVELDGAGEPPPEPYLSARTSLDLYHAVVAFPGEPPANATLRRLPGAELPGARVAELTHALRTAVETHATLQRSTDGHAPRWASQGIENLTRIAELPSVAALRGAFAGRPCFLVSPGPSLGRNVHLLREVAGRGLVMTCTHALAALDAAGVVPDLIVAGDPQVLSRHFEGYDVSAAQALVFDAAVHPSHYGLPARRVFTFASHADVDRWIFGPLRESALLASGGSVACSELSLAQAIGCDPIVLVGQDLALSDGRYYVETSVDGGARLEPSADGASFVLVRPVKDPDTGEVQLVRHPAEELVPVPANGGGSVPTSASLHMFLRWFQVAARSTDARLVNCTEGGAHIDGMEHRPLAELLGELRLESREPLDVGAVLDRAAGAVDVARRRRTMRAEVERTLARAEEGVRAARECGRLALAVRRGSAELDELSAAEGRLAEVLRELPFFSMLAQERIRDAQQRGARAETLEANLRATEELYGVVEEAGRTTIAPLRGTLVELGDGRSADSGAKA